MLSSASTNSEDAGRPTVYWPGSTAATAKPSSTARLSTATSWPLTRIEVVPEGISMLRKAYSVWPICQSGNTRAARPARSTWKTRVVVTLSCVTRAVTRYPSSPSLSEPVISNPLIRSPAAPAIASVSRACSAEGAFGAEISTAVEASPSCRALRYCSTCFSGEYRVLETTLKVIVSPVTRTSAAPTAMPPPIRSLRAAGDSGTGAGGCWTSPAAAPCIGTDAGTDSAAAGAPSAVAEVAPVPGTVAPAAAGASGRRNQDRALPGR